VEEFKQGGSPGGIGAGDELSLLVVSFYYPPHSAVGARRVSRFCSYLPDFGIHPAVLTIDEASCGSPDRSIALPAGVPVHRVRPRLSLLNRLQQRAADRAPARSSAAGSSTPEPGTEPAPGKRWFGLRSSFFALQEIPDGNRGWFKPAVRAGCDLLRATRFDALFSSGPPWTTHSVAYVLSRRHRLPWICDFRDNWVSDPWRKYAYDGDGMPWWRNCLDWRLEDRWLRQASAIICTSDWQRKALLESHPSVAAERAVIIFNSFDVAPPQASVAAGSGGQRVLLHAGTLYRERRLEPFCQALARLVQAGEVAPDSLKVIFLGDVEDDIEAGARRTVPDLFQKGVVEFQPPCSWEAAQGACARASVLLLFQGEHPTAIPAKFYEYLRTGCPVLGIAKDGALKQMILETGAGVVADPDSVEEIAGAIQTALRMPVRTAAQIAPLLARFDARQLTGQLAGQVRRALSRL